MLRIPDSVRGHLAAAAGVILSVSIFGFAQQPRLSVAERQKIASRFHFTKFKLPEPTGGPLKIVRRVHPSLERISAWVSAVGAGIALADLDGDGLPNDCVQIEPRTDEIRIGPAPGTGDRYKWFSIDPRPLPYDSSNTAPTGCLVGDLNEDGLNDVVVYFWGRTPVAFLQTPVAFLQKPAAGTTTASTGLAGAVLGCSLEHTGTPLGASVEHTGTPLGASSFVAAELASEPAAAGKPALWNTGAASLADLDGDGHQDLIFGNYYQDGAPVLDPKATGVLALHDTKSRAFNGGRKHFLLWRSGQGGAKPAVRFAEVEDVVPDHISRGWTTAQATGDIDGDLRPDIYFAHDLGPDRLLINRSTPGKLRFSLVEGRRDFFTPSSFVLGKDSFKGMGCEFGDINNDLIPDIYVSNIACQFGLQESHFLWLSHGSPDAVADAIAGGIAPYVQASEPLGLSRSGWAWDCRLADFDNDGTPEAMQAIGFLKGKINRWPELQALGTSNSELMEDPRNWPSFKCGDDVSGHEPNAFFVRAADGRYYDLAHETGLDDRTVSRGIAVADVDGDGDLDFAIANQWEPSYFWRNDSPKVGKHMQLKLLLRKTGQNKSGTEVFPGLNAVGPQGINPDGISVNAGNIDAVGAQVRLTLPGGKTMLGQVDGGSGHSGKRSHEVHFGLGDLPDGAAKIKTNIAWRRTDGRVERTTLTLSPGSWTVVLNNRAPGGQKQ